MRPRRAALRRLAVFAFVAVSVGAPFGACTSPPEIPVFEIERVSFVNRVSAEGTLRAKEKTKISVPPTVRRRVRLAWVAREGVPLEKGDLVARFDGKDFEEKLQEARSDLSGTDSDVVRTRADSDLKLGEYQRDFEIADLDLDFARRFQLTDELIFSRNQIVEDAIDEELATAKRSHAESMSGVQRSLAETELEILGIERRKSDLKIEEAEEGLASLEVRAPHAGILTLVRNWRGEPPAVGGEMWRGQEIGEIPALGVMEAEVFVLEADAGGLAEGKRAGVVVEAHPEVVYPARVARVEAVAKPRAQGSPVQYFGVTLEIEETDPEIMKPGQRVVASLFLEELDEAIVVPRQAVLQENGASWVFRRGREGFEPRRVEIGASSAGLLVIAGGLEEGDIVALGRPPGGDLPEAASPKIAEAKGPP